MSDDDLELAIAAYTDAYKALEAFVRHPKSDGAGFGELWDDFKKAENRYDGACRAAGRLRTEASPDRAWDWRVTPCSAVALKDRGRR